MGLFDKKTCDICGGKIGMLGNRKLDDGNCCKDCAKQLSPFFSERRKSTVADINAQLQYREQNKAEVARFNVTRTLGIVTKVFIDEDAGKFAISSAKRFGEDNPDIMDVSQVTGCIVDIQESSNEIKRKDANGKEVSHVPPRFSYSFTFYIVIHVNSPWFSEIRFPLTKSVEVETVNTRPGMAGTAEIGRKSNDYRQAEAMGNDIKMALTKPKAPMSAGQSNFTSPGTSANAPVGVPVSVPVGVPASTPQGPRECPLCGATCMPDAQGCCEFCGGRM